MFNLVALLKLDCSDLLLLSISPQPVLLHQSNDISDKLETSSEKELPDWLLVVDLQSSRLIGVVFCTFFLFYFENCLVMLVDHLQCIKLLSNCAYDCVIFPLNTVCTSCPHALYTDSCTWTHIYTKGQSGSQSTHHVFGRLEEIHVDTRKLYTPHTY